MLISLRRGRLGHLTILRRFKIGSLEQKLLSKAIMAGKPMLFQKVRVSI